MISLSPGWQPFRVSAPLLSPVNCNYGALIHSDAEMVCRFNFQQISRRHAIARADLSFFLHDMLFPGKVRVTSSQIDFLLLPI